MTPTAKQSWFTAIIPYQELLGNYDIRLNLDAVQCIIPYQELLGNYDFFSAQETVIFIIPYQELLVNHPPNKIPLAPKFLPRRP